MVLGAHQFAEFQAQFQVQHLLPGLRGHRVHLEVRALVQVREHLPGVEHAARPGDRHHQAVFALGGRSPGHFKPSFGHRASTFCLISGDISMTSGQSRVKPSSSHLRVQSTPILLP